MAEKSFGVKEINLIGASGTPTIESPNNLNLNAVNVAISTNATIGGDLTVSGTVGIAGTLTYEDVTNVDAVGIITARDGIKIPDSKNARFGTDNDAIIYHNGNHLFIKEQDAGQIFIDGAAGVTLQTAGTTRIATQSDGGYVTGNLGVSNKISAASVNIGSNIQLGNAGVVTATTFSGSGASLTNLPAANLTGTLPAISGANLTNLPSDTPADTDVQITFDISASGSSGYIFTGPGNDGSTVNPDIYLVRGQRYRFINTTGSAHPFEFRNAANNADYTDGITGSQSGTQDFNVQYDAPAQLKYRCTIHTGSMVGNIYITGQQLINGADNRLVTASGAYGLNGESNLTFDGNNLAMSGTGVFTLTRNSRTLTLEGNYGNEGHPAIKTSSGHDLRIMTSGNNERLRIDSNGMIGIGGVTPKTQNTFDAIEFGKTGFLGSQTGARTVEMASNAYYNSGWKYKENDVASQYYQYQGYHAFTSAVSGSADGAITFTEHLRIASAGQIGLSGANYGTSGQVLTSQGSSSAPIWTTITGTTINNNQNNAVITGSGTANTLEAEANLTFTGSILTVTNNSGASELTLVTPNNTDSGVYFNDGSNAGAVTYQHSDNSMRFRVNSTEKLRISKNGQLLHGNYSEDQGWAVFWNAAGSGADAGTAGQDAAGDQGVNIRSDMGPTHLDLTGTDNFTLKLSNQAYNGAGVANPQGTISKILFNTVTHNGWNSYGAICLESQGTSSARGELVFMINDGTSSMAERLRITSGGFLGVGNGGTYSIETPLDVVFNHTTAAMDIVTGSNNNYQGDTLGDITLSRRHSPTKHTTFGYSASMIDFRATNTSQEWSVGQILGHVDPHGGSGYKGGLSILVNRGGEQNPSGRRTKGEHPQVSTLFTSQRVTTFSNETVSSQMVLHLTKNSASGSTAQNMISFDVGGGGRGQIKSATSGTALPTLAAYSDRRLKTNFRNYTGGYDKIKQIPVKLYDEVLNDDTKSIILEAKKDVIGWIADEVQSIFPDAVSGTKDEVDSDGKPVYQSVAGTAFLPDAIQAIQKLIQKVEILETEVAALKSS